MHTPRRSRDRRLRFARCLVALAFVVLGVAATPGAAGAQNTVTGSFTVKGASTAFAHVYAFWKPNAFNGQPNLHLFFTDVPIPADAIPDDNDAMPTIAGVIRDGKVHGIELHLAPGFAQLDRADDVAVYHVGLSPARFGMGNMSTYEATSVTAKTIEGRARTNGPQKHEGVTWQYDLRFTVAIPPQPK